MPSKEKDIEGQQQATQTEPAADDTSSAAQAQDPAAAQTAESASDLPKTQEELDKLIERRLKKEQKKWEKTQAQAQTAEAKTEGDGNAAAASDNSAELAQLKAALQEAKAQNTAVKLGFKPDVVDDAVYLAMRNAAKNNDGDPDDEDIKTELSAVLKKHPEWKAGEGKTTGFRVGAPAPQQNAAAVKPTAQKRWNRFN